MSLAAFESRREGLPERRRASDLRCRPPDVSTLSNHAPGLSFLSSDHFQSGKAGGGGAEDACGRGEGSGKVSLAAFECRREYRRGDVVSSSR